MAPEKLTSQCIADAGEDGALCTFWGLDTFYLGGSPTANGGTPPYTYSWACTYSDEWFTYTAENFLDDASIANPRIVDWASIDDPLKFYLTVTDNAGLYCIDSVIIQFSLFSITLDEKHAHIHQGDSVQLYTSVYGGIPPLTYQWSPTTGLTDPTDVYTYAKPETTTTYFLMVTDSAGCQVGDNFYVFVIPTSTNEFQNNQIKVNIFPNPLIDASRIVISNSANSSNYEMYMYDANGRFKKKLVISNGSTEIESSDFENGIYFYKLLDKNVMVIHGIFVVQ